MRTVQRRGPRADAAPVYSVLPTPGAPLVATQRLDGGATARVAPGSHAHDFPGFAYFPSAGGTLGAGSAARRIEPGDLYVLAPGDMITIDDPRALAAAEGWGVFFLPEALQDEAPWALLSWWAHPLLAPFARGTARGPLRLQVPPGRRADWLARIEALHAELTTRRDGYREAAVAHLVLLLVDITRLAAEVIGEIGGPDPLLAGVFASIERRFRGPLSLRDVAREVALSPGHLTTTVRRRTGRTVQDWIVERRMSEARTLLLGTDLSVEEIGRAVGLPDPSYFARVFRRTHGTGPRRWRRAARDDALGPTTSARRASTRPA